jgi:hypothetical protein
VPSGHVVPAEVGGAGQAVGAQARAQAVVVDDPADGVDDRVFVVGLEEQGGVAAGLRDRAAPAGGHRAA